MPYLGSNITVGYLLVGLAATQLSPAKVSYVAAPQLACSFIDELWCDFELRCISFFSYDKMFV